MAPFIAPRGEWGLGNGDGDWPRGLLSFVRLACGDREAERMGRLTIGRGIILRLTQIYPTQL